MNKILGAITLFYHRLGSYPWFYSISSKLLPISTILAFMIFLLGIVWGIFYSPSDVTQGEIYRIIYMHVPAASVAQSIYFFSSNSRLCLFSLENENGRFIH